MSRRHRRASAVAVAIATVLIAGCNREPDHLPDIASDMSSTHTVLLNHVEEQGGPPQTFGPFSSLTDMDMFAACLGGGKLTLSTAKGGIKLWGLCNGTRIGGLQFDSGSGKPRCLTMTLEGEVTAWEVVVTQSKPFDDRPAPSFFAPPTPDPRACETV
jgi:hypothetical protein